MKKILCVADAPGPAEFLLPVLPLLKEKAEVVVLGYGKAFEVLQGAGALEVKTEEEGIEVYKKFNPGILVEAISSLTKGPFIINKLIERAHAESVPVVCLQDIWANHRWPHNASSLKYANLVCTLDEFAASLWKEDGFKGKIQVTGNPGFEKFGNVDVVEERARLRARLHLSAVDKVILYAGQGTPRAVEEDKKTFKLLTDSLRLIKDFPIKLIVRPHPRAEETGYYKEYAQNLEVVDTKSIHFSENILPAADLIVSIFATNLIHACYLRIPAMSILLPGAGGEITEVLRLKDFPPNTMGATVGVYKEDSQELKEKILKILTDETFRGSLIRAQKSNFILDGKSAERTCLAILGV